MRIKVVYILTAFILIITACSSRDSSLPNVTTVTYRETSGTISPDTAWEERYAVSTVGLTFVRTGYSALTTVNTGTWTINSFGANEAQLLSDLSGIDVYNVKNIGLGTPPVIGGGIKVYTIRYANGEIREVITGDGSGYSNAEAITTPINNYILNITLPVGASKRYKSVPMGGAIQGNPLTLSSLVTTIAGTPGIPLGSFADGTGAAARFAGPWQITTDGINLYVADYGNHAIRKIVISSGLVSTMTGSAGVPGSTDGTGTAALFNWPQGITTDGANLYVADTSNHTIRIIVISSGIVSTLTGSAGVPGSTDGTGTEALFSWPYGITTDGTNLYVADTGNSTIRKIVIASREVTTLAGTAGPPGHDDGIGSAARFNRPGGITTDGINLYVSDSVNSTIRKIEISSRTVTTLAGSVSSQGSNDGIGTAAKFSVPYGITTDGTNLYVTDENNTIRKIVIASTEVTTLAGQAASYGSTDGVGASARFWQPCGITTNGISLFVSDTNNHIIRQIK